MPKRQKQMQTDKGFSLSLMDRIQIRVRFSESVELMPHDGSQ